MKLKIQILSFLCATITFSMGFVIHEFYQSNKLLNARNSELNYMLKDAIDHYKSIAYEQEQKAVEVAKICLELKQQLKACHTK